MERIAFIGTGVMGQAMAGHLLEAGYALTVSNRSPAKARALVERGAAWADTPAEAAAGAAYVFTMLGYPADVEAAYFGAAGLIAAADPGCVLIDMTTSSPALARRIAAAAAERGQASLDAPVSGGDVGARAATLSIMVGGDPDAVEAARPLFALLGKTVIRQGGPGAGQSCKLANQIAVAANMVGVAEALTFGAASGLDPRTMLASIGSGAAGSWSLANLLPRMLAGNVAPGFYIKHFIKDLKLAVDEAVGLGLPLPGVELALRLYRALAALTPAELEAASAAAADRPGFAAAAFAPAAASGADLGTQAVYLLYAAGRADV
jgi:3-hydroxyisobutyrate dehydrogenase